MLARSIAIALAGLLAGTVAAAEGPGPVAEYELKAAFLFNFAKFVRWSKEDWPDTIEEPVTICVVGADPFGDVLDRTVAGKTVKSHPVAVRRLPPDAEPAGCQIAFVGSSEGPPLGRLLGRLAEAGVLTVGETEDFTERGGMIGFRLRENRIRLEINVEAARRGRLQVSSQLLKVAKVVTGPTP